MNMVAGVGGEEREVAVKCDYVVDVEQGWLLLGVVERERVDVRWTDGRERWIADGELIALRKQAAAVMHLHRRCSRSFDPCGSFPDSCSWTRLSSKQQATRRAMHHS